MTKLTSLKCFLISDQRSADKLITEVRCKRRKSFIGLRSANMLNINAPTVTMTPLANMLSSSLRIREPSDTIQYVNAMIATKLSALYACVHAPR